MNAWNLQEIGGEPLLESCDFCNVIIINWDTLLNSFVTFDGRIACKNCFKSLDNV
jgi:hypothetical protein